MRVFQRWKYQKFLFWQEEDDLLQWMKDELFNEITELLSKRERNIDVQVTSQGHVSCMHKLMYMVETHVHYADCCPVCVVSHKVDTDEKGLV